MADSNVRGSSGRGAVLLTGASGGLGSALARALASDGWPLLLAGRRREPLDALAMELQQAEVWVTDLAEPGDLQVPADSARQGISVVIHGAAAFPRYGRIKDLGDDQLEAALRVNLGAGLRLAKACSPGMAQRGWGRFVFLGSQAAACGAHGQAAYAASKAGLAGLVRSLALEGGRRGITANLLELGLFDTPAVRDRLGAEGFEDLAAASALGRAGSPQELSAIVRFLLSSDGGFVTGAVLPVDGGLSLGWGERGRPS